MPLVFSFGGGVQSTAMLLFIQEEMIPRPDVIIFADTGDEPKSVYDHVENVCKPLAKELNIPFYVGHFGGGGLAHRFMADMRSEQADWPASIPFHTIQKSTGDKGILPRQCTKNAKIMVVKKTLVSDVYGYSKVSQIKEPIVLMQGISWDEKERMTVNKIKFFDNFYPLIMDKPVSHRPFEFKKAPITRAMCVERLEKAGINAPKSSCYYCPYKSAKQWVDMKHNEPDEFARAVALDNSFRDPSIEVHDRYKDFDLYISAQLVPLQDIEEMYNSQKKQSNWLDIAEEMECSGTCWT